MVFNPVNRDMTNQMSSTRLLPSLLDLWRAHSSSRHRSRVFFGVVAMVGTLGLAACANVTPTLGTNGVLIEQVTVVSPHLAVPLANTDVALENGLIVAIGNNIDASSGARRIDGRGKYLIPGLIDSHVHVKNLVGLDRASATAYPQLVAAYRAQVPRSFLAFGFTTLIDLDITPQERALFEETPLHPRLYTCSSAVNVSGGYGFREVPQDATEENFPTLVFEPTQSARWPTSLDPREHTPRKIVERIAEAQGICVKVFVEPGFGFFNWPVPSRETLDALRSESTSHGLMLVVHANSIDSWRAALDAKADVIAHGLWQWPGNRLDTEPSEEGRAILQRAASSGVGVQPTIRVVHSDRAMFEPILLADPRLEWSLPRQLFANLGTEGPQTARKAVMTAYESAAARSGVTGGALAMLDAGIARAMVTARAVSDMNGRLLFGSDTPSASGVSIGNPPGLNGRLELEHWFAAGIPRARILRAATLDNATTFGLSKELGSIETGKRADLLLLTSNPLESVQAYDAIEIVFLNGEPIVREALRPADTQ
jgi:imidazolonepropionase-like amidohydrolase